MHLPELATDERFLTQQLRAANQEAMLTLLQPVFLTQTKSYWLTEMDRRGVPCSPINNYPEILSDEHVDHMQLVQPLRLPNGVETHTTAYPVSMKDYTFEIYREPPELGAHNEQISVEWLGSAQEQTNT